MTDLSLIELAAGRENRGCEAERNKLLGNRSALRLVRWI